MFIMCGVAVLTKNAYYNPQQVTTTTKYVEKTACVQYFISFLHLDIVALPSSYPLALFPYSPISSTIFLSLIFPIIYFLSTQHQQFPPLQKKTFTPPLHLILSLSVSRSLSLMRVSIYMWTKRCVKAINNKYQQETNKQTQAEKKIIKALSPEWNGHHLFLLFFLTL